DAEDVVRLRSSGSFRVQPELANRGADLMFSWLSNPRVKRIAGYGALNGAQAAEQVRGYWKWVEVKLKEKGYPDLNTIHQSVPLSPGDNRPLTKIWNVLDEAGIEVRPIIYGSGWNRAFSGNSN